MKKIVNYVRFVFVSIFVATSISAAMPQEASSYTIKTFEDVDKTNSAVLFLAQQAWKYFEHFNLVGKNSLDVNMIPNGKATCIMAYVNNTPMHAIGIFPLNENEHDTIAPSISFYFLSNNIPYKQCCILGICFIPCAKETEAVLKILLPKLKELAQTKGYSHGLVRILTHQNNCELDPSINALNKIFTTEKIYSKETPVTKNVFEAGYCITF